MVQRQYISLSWGFNDIKPLDSLNISSILSFFLFINRHEIDVEGLRADSSPGERGSFGYFKCRANRGYVFSTKAMRNNIATLLIGFSVMKGKSIKITLFLSLFRDRTGSRGMLLPHYLLYVLPVV